MPRRLALILPSLVALASCTSSRTFVLEPVKDGVLHGHVGLRRLETTARADPKAQEQFEGKLAEQIKTYVGAQVVASPAEPTDLILEYKFVLFDAGSTGARLGSGLASLAGSPIYGIGDGSVGVEVRFKRPDGALIGHIVTDGPISGAFGSTSGALDSAASAVAKYTKANFTCAHCGQVGAPAPEKTSIAGLTSAPD